jgi:predicted ribosomally synthesized peptide with SipW-like signal peptide
MKINKRRMTVIAAGVGAVGAITALGLGGTSALYTSQAGGQQNSIESGTVVLTKNVNKSFDFNIDGFMPGDTTPTSKYWLDYSGEDAFVGLDLTITSSADKPCAAYVGHPGSLTPADVMASCSGTGTVPMFNGDATSGSLDLSILPQNGTTAHQLFDYTTGPKIESGTTCAADAAGLVTCTVQKNNVIVPPGYMSAPITEDELAWHNGSADWITVKAALPLAAPNIFQGSDVHIAMTAHAVQYANNHVPVSGFEGILPNGIYGTGSQAAVHFPDNFS